MARKPELPTLAKEAWLADPHLQKLLRVLNAHGEARVAGGAVRNALLGVPVADVDVATTLSPQDVTDICSRAGLGVHPTGIEHGTVTVTSAGHAFEVTTLRKDVETDGRRAVVSFTTDWAVDAARRDFTINALYCDCNGKIYDFTDGYSDILKRKVRFVGAASTRIREDYLRILRFFRFHAQYGKGAMNERGLRACARLKSGLLQLSAERLRQEMMKLLVAPRAVATLKVMAAHGILRKILPYTDEWRVIDRLPRDSLLRLFALSASPAELKEKFRLSNAHAKRIDALLAAPDVSPRLTLPERRRLNYQLGDETWRDVVLLCHAHSRSNMTDEGWLLLAETHDLPVFPLSGRDLAARGVKSGPEMGRLLRELEDWWLASDFKPGKEELLQRLEQ